MDKYFSVLRLNPLFADVEEENLNLMLNCLGFFEKSYMKNEFLLHEGQNVDYVGIVLAGKLNIIKSDFGGNEMIVASVAAGEMFCEVFACAGINRSPVSVTAVEKSKVLFIDFKKVISSCESSCVFHARLISNMLRVMATKTLFLNRKIEILSKKTLREKILCYFEYERGGKSQFRIGFNRQELANFLCADRSALSGELSKMQKEGIITYMKNDFKITV